MISHPVRSDPRFLHIREHATNTNNAIINNKYKYKYIIATPLAVSPLVVSYKRAHNKLAIQLATSKLSVLTKSGVGQTD